MTQSETYTHTHIHRERDGVCVSLYPLCVCMCLCVCVCHICVCACPGVSPEDLEACLLLGTSQKRRHHVLSSLTPDRAQRVRHILEGELCASICIRTHAYVRRVWYLLIRSLCVYVCVCVCVCVLSFTAAESHSASDSATGGHTWHGQQVVSAALSRGGESELDEIVAR